MDQPFEQDNSLEHFCGPSFVDIARRILSRDEQSEEEFLGAQAILLFNGLI